jgi:hypothetical protein
MALKQDTNSHSRPILLIRMACHTSLVLLCPNLLRTIWRSSTHMEASRIWTAASWMLWVPLRINKIASDRMALKIVLQESICDKVQTLAQVSRTTRGTLVCNTTNKGRSLVEDNTRCQKLTKHQRKSNRIMHKMNNSELLNVTRQIKMNN